MRKILFLGNLYMGLVYLFLLLPLIVIIVSAFGSTEHVMFPPKDYTLRWFKDALTNNEFWQSIVITMKISVLSVCISTVLGVSASIYLWKSKSKWKKIYEVMFTVPIIIPTVISAVAFLIYFSKFSFMSTFWKLTLCYTVLQIPYVIRSVSASLSTLDASFEEASLVLGARPLKTIVQVILPCVKSGILVGVIFAFIVAFDESVIVLFIRDSQTITYPLRLYSYITQSFTPLVSAFATIFIVLTFAFIFVLDKKIGIGSKL